MSLLSKDRPDPISRACDDDYHGYCEVSQCHCSCHDELVTLSPGEYAIRNSRMASVTFLAACRMAAMAQYPGILRLSERRFAVIERESATLHGKSACLQFGLASKPLKYEAAGA